MSDLDNPNESAHPAASLPPGPAPANDTTDLQRILDLPVTIHVELGSRRMSVSELLEISVGSTLELDAAAGSPLSVYANQTLVARGEAVVIGERYGVRLTEIVSQRERVRRLGR